MKEFERALLGAQPPDLPVAEFRRTLRHELLKEETARKSRLVRRAIGGLAAGVIVLIATVGLFVARPSVPMGLNAALFNDPDSQEAGASEFVAPTLGLSQLAVNEKYSVAADEDWLNQIYAGELEATRIKSSIDQRFFALRRYELFSGRQIVVFTEVGTSSPGETPAVISQVRQF